MNWQKPTLGTTIFKYINYIFLAGLCLITILPVFYVFSMSIRAESDLVRYGQTLFPKNISFDAYKELFSGNKIIDAFKVSSFLAIMGTLVSLFMNLLIAYPLSKTYLPYARVVAFLLYFTVLFGGGLIPWYLLMKFLHLTNSLWGIIINGCISSFNVMMFRNFFFEIPHELEESAKIDGAGDFLILWKIFVPLSKPVIATIALFTSIGWWNEWFSVLILIDDRAKWSLQLILRETLQSGLTAELQQAAAAYADTRPSETLKMAVVVVATLPLMCLYPFLQKYFVKGVTMGAVKG